MTTLITAERGWPGHYICADRCRFRRNTLLRVGDVRVVVSTVGAHAVPNGRRFDRFVAVGAGYYYETAAFMAQKTQCSYWDADISRPIVGENGRDILPHADEDWHGDVPPEADARANTMHDTLVQAVAAEMLAGTLRYCSGSGFDAVEVAAFPPSLDPA